MKSTQLVVQGEISKLNLNILKYVVCYRPIAQNIIGENTVIIALCYQQASVVQWLISLDAFKVFVKKVS